MTKHLRLIMLSLLAMICMGGYAQSEEDFTKKTWSNPYPFEHYEIVGEQGGNVNKNLIPLQNDKSKDIRCYAKNKLTITSTQGKMKKIVFVLSAQGKKQCGQPTVDNGTVTRSPNSGDISEVIWENPNGSASVTFTVGASNNWGTNKSKSTGQLCFDKIIITDLVSGKDDSEIKFKEAAKEVELKTEMMSLSDLISNPHNLPLTYSTSDKETAEELDGSLHLHKTGKVTVTASFIGDDTYAATSTSMELTIVDNRLDAGISFAKDSYTAGIAKGTFNEAELVNPKVLGVKYEITPTTEGVSIAQDGTVTYPAVEATYTVTAKFDGNDTYKPATATYTLNVVDPNFETTTIEFVAGVDKGTGANTNSIKDDMISKGIVTVSSTRACLGLKGYYAFYRPVSSNEGIHTISTRMGTITKIAFEAGNGTEPSKATFKEGTYTKDNDGTKNYTWTGSEKAINFTVTASTYYSKITVTVKVPVAKDYTLDENSVNTIEAYENANVTLKRTFYKDGEWNTLCLPFAVNATDFEGAEVREVDVTQSSENTLVFKEATTIKAGKPYLIKWAKTPNEVCDFVNTFEGVTLVATATPVKVNDAITFTGFYNKATADKLGASVAAIGAGNKLFKVTSGEMKGFRAAFVLNPATPAAGIKVVIDGTTTGIEDLVVDGVKAIGRVYNLNGQYVGNNLNGLQPGIYIQNGKKVVVK